MFARTRPELVHNGKTTGLTAAVQGAVVIRKDCLASFVYSERGSAPGSIFGGRSEVAREDEKWESAKSVSAAVHPSHLPNLTRVSLWTRAL